MKIHVLGGGPAGLYFAILTKKRDPRAEIVVHERNAEGVTFGWGVVFSDDTLSNLGDADRESYDAIRASFAYWDAIEVWNRGEVVRSGGHGFCGIERKRLLQILTARARELGVDVRFGSTVSDVEALRDADLFVAADGVNSAVREHYRDRFSPRSSYGKSRYVWLGSDKKLETFSFFFRETEHGVFQVHAYQFSPHTSTFIVECDEATFERAGLASATEADTITFAERVFADDLRGARLFGNRSSWLRFNTLTCERWQFENVVLLGDASHTAHFSIGSGTKLAMEDAIELAASMATHPRVPDALHHYDEARRPLVARIQTAARQSQAWFENTPRYVSLPIEQLAFSLLSRTRRVTHDNLALRDASYVESVDRWFSASADARGPTATALPGTGKPTPPMFTPFSLRGVTLENRVVVSPMCQYSAEDGLPNDWHLVHLGSRAVGGAGLVIAEMTNVSPEGRITPGCTGIWSDAHVAGWARIVDFVHGASRAKIGLQLGHAGRKGSTRLPWEAHDEALTAGGWETLGPSARAYASTMTTPREMTREDMANVRRDYALATERARRAGFDLVELHLAHGYLLSSFVSPIANVRTDAYGGSLEGRARFPLEVLDVVREKWDGPLSVRISATDWVDGGFTIDEAVELSRLLRAHGADLVDVSAGGNSPEQAPEYGRAFQMPFSERIRLEVGVPTITVGNIWNADMINTILVAGRADLVAMARMHLADPYFALHAATTQGFGGDEIWPVQYRAGKTMSGRT